MDRSCAVAAEAETMNLRVITVLAGAKVGGAETFFTTLSAALARAGLNVRSVLKAMRSSSWAGRRAFRLRPGASIEPK